mmetsp:Transcript_55832/g.148783  ORF Transcript_55832/g.148783 Transcript_55832/m.148783 type:complete len:124 (-) Transcript_55832:335-706(-)
MSALYNTMLDLCDAKPGVVGSVAMGLTLAVMVLVSQTVETYSASVSMGFIALLTGAIVSSHLRARTIMLQEVPKATLHIEEIMRECKRMQYAECVGDVECDRSWSSATSVCPACLSGIREFGD